jgi:hypothetical protein
MKTVRLADGRKYECGAGRIQDTHTHVIALAKELGLTLTDPSAGATSSFIDSRGTFYETSPAPELHTRLKNQIKHTDKLIENPLIYFMNRYLSQEERRLLTESLAYEFLLYKSNAKGALEELAAVNGKYLFVIEGVDSITTRLYERIHDKITVLMEEEVLAVHQDRTITTTQQKTYPPFDEIVITTPIHITKKIIGSSPLLEGIVGIPLIRIYASYPKKWWPDHRVITALPNMQVIPISDTIIMAAYAGGDTARMWKGLTKEETEKTLVRLLRHNFPQSPEPEWIDVCDWEVGVHSWKPYYDEDLLIPRFINYAPGVHIVGEIATDVNGWMEGALRSVERFLRNQV